MESKKGFRLQPTDDWPMEMVDALYEGAQRNLTEQVQTMMNSRRRAETMLGWMLAALMAVSGALTMNLLSGNPNRKAAIVEICAVAVIFVSSMMIIFGVMMFRNYHSAGLVPSNALRDDVRGCLLQVDKDRRNFLAKWYWIADSEYAYNKNMESMLSERKWYRISIFTLVAGIAAVLMALLLIA